MNRYMGQIMAECDCQHPACAMRGICMAARIEELWDERDHWRDVAGREGVCMSCRGPEGASETYGCTDCRLQTDEGSADRVVAHWNTRAAQPPTLAEALALPEVRALVEALGVYADPSSYSDGGREKGVLQSFIWQDKGHRARAALAAQEGEG